KTVASASVDRTIKLWDVDTGKMARFFKGHYSPICGLSFFPDGKTLASASDHQKVGLWDLATGKEIHRHPSRQEMKNVVAFLNGSDKLLTGDWDDTIRWWDWRRGHLERSISWPTHTARSTIVSGDRERIAAASRNGGFLLFETNSGKEVGRF